jgi:glycerol-3-phosphate dehydrogenase
MPEAPGREALLAGLDGRAFDAVVIGGGINGAAVARDAALRGLRVCLLEKGDFAGGTSSRSTKIAHGGLRYLKQLELGLVFESQQERRVLRRLLPHLVTPQSFLYSVYEGGPDPLWRVRLGLTVYDLLAGFGDVRRHRPLQPAEALATNPSLRPEGLLGAVRYWDDRMDDARICLENVLSAGRAGAVCLSYVEALEARPEGRGMRLRYRDRLGTMDGSIEAGAVVNCGGPWADEVLGRVGAGGRRRLVSPSKGVHIVVPRVAGEDALILGNPDDGRTFFAIPWEDRTLIGTTDTFFEGDPSAVAPEREEIDYLLRAAAHYLPKAGVRAPDVSLAFAALRPLAAPARAGLAPGRVSRRHRVVVGPGPIVTLIGGKFTTYRRMAAHATDALLRVLRRPRRPSPTRDAPFFPDEGSPPGADAEPEIWRQLRASYGPRAATVFEFCLSDQRFLRPVLESSAVRVGQLAYAVLHEQARTMEDVLFRRTRLSWQPDLTPAVARRLAGELASLFPGGAPPDAEGIEEVVGRRGVAGLRPAASL